MMIYVVLISDEDGNSSYIHSVYSDKGVAEDMVQRLESSLSGMMAHYEEHELQESNV